MQRTNQSKSRPTVTLTTDAQLKQVQRKNVHYLYVAGSKTSRLSEGKCL